MKRISTLIIIALISFSNWAETIQAKGMGTISYKVLTPEVKAEAEVKAQMKAIEGYFAKLGDSASENFDAIQDKIQADLDKYILSTVTLNEQDQPDTHKYTRVVRVELNASKLNNLLKNSSSAGQNAKAGGIKSKLVYIFLGREVESVREFDDRVSKRVEMSVKVQATPGLVKGNQPIDAKGKASMETEAGGSSLHQTEKVTYRLLPMQDYDSSITSEFSKGGYAVVDPAMAIDDKDFNAAKENAAKGSDLSAETKRGFVKKMQANQIQYLILTTLDVGQPAQDDATGLRRGSVKVTTRVLDWNFTEVVSVPSVGYSATAPNNKEASDIALKKAAMEASKEVVSRLNTLGIR